MEIKILQNPIARKELAGMAKMQFGDWIKAVVDLEHNTMAVGGEFHADMQDCIRIRLVKISLHLFL